MFFAISLVLKVLHIALCVGLVFFVLIQSSKGGGLSGAFGTGAETMFGYSQANRKLAQFTTYCAIGFFLTCLTLGLLPATKSNDRPIVTNMPEEMPVQDPLAPLTNPESN